MQKSDKVIPEKVIGFEFGKNVYDNVLQWKDAIIYALGIGFSRDPMNEDDHKFTYELKDEFTVFPTIAATFADVKDAFGALDSNPGIPKFNPMMILHGEQHLEIIRPLRTGFRLITKGKIADIADKGKGAFAIFELNTYEVEEDGKETHVIRQYMGLFIRGIGGFGYKGTVQLPLPAPPKRDPCKTLEEKTEANQAILYRLAGDVNPLHIDPQMASMGGFDKPILHGLCTYGVCARAIAKGWCDNNTDKIKKVSARFTSHVFPGETLKIKTWKEGSKIIFTAETAERGLVCIQGFVELNEQNAKL